MEDNHPKPNRKLPRLKNYDYSRNGYYFVTICAVQHRKLFSEIEYCGDSQTVRNTLTNVGKVLAQELAKLPDRFTGLIVDKYVIMPNHIHIIFAIQAQGQGMEYSISDVVCAFKSLTARKIRQFRNYDSVFQKSFPDHIIRGQEDYSNIWLYIDSNPVNWKKDCFYLGRI